MPQSSRSIVVRLSDKLHLAYDVERFRVHTAWEGGPLHLFGPGYHGAKEPFICQVNGQRLWGNPPFPEWLPGDTWHAPDTTNSRPAHLRFTALSTKGGRSTFIYELRSGNGTALPIRETPALVAWADTAAISRALTVGARTVPLTYQAHLEPGQLLFAQKNFAAIQRTNDVLVVALRTADPQITSTAVPGQFSYQEEVFTEGGSSKGNPRREISGAHVAFAVQLPKGEKPLLFEIITAVVSNEAAARKLAAAVPIAKPNPASLQPLIVAAELTARRSLVRSPHYSVEAFPVPKQIELLVTGMDWLPNGDLVVCTWLGDVFLLRGAQGDPAKVTYQRFARGLNEPLGLSVVGGKIYVGQKNEITRLTDTDGNGEADLYESVNNQWDYTGGYNSFVYGPVTDARGNLVVANAAHGGRWDAKHMGWALRVSVDGTKLEPICSGLREPNGIGVFGHDRDIFVTENQGQWIGACKLNHVKDGKFFGHPSSWPAPREDYKGRSAFDPPAVWFPYKLARSTTGLVEIKDDKLGPFKGQLLVGDFQNALITRVQLEKVGGEWQGAVWPFLSGFLSGVNRLTIGADGCLYVGGCQRTWASVAPQSHALERVKFNGITPFEIQQVHARRDGFELRFTKPIDEASADEAFDVWQYSYKYHAGYGSPEMDHEGKPDRQTTITIKRVTVSPDKLTVRLIVEGWKAGCVTGIRAAGVRGVGCEKLLHDTLYYTLNKIPE